MEAHLKLTIPLRVSSRSNSRASWQAKARVTKSERMITALVARSNPELMALARVAVGAYSFGGPALVVTLTRCAPRPLDDDNLRDAMKAVRDELAAQLELRSDRDPAVRWEYTQKNGRGVLYAVEVEFR